MVAKLVRLGTALAVVVAVAVASTTDAWSSGTTTTVVGAVTQAPTVAPSVPHGPPEDLPAAQARPIDPAVLRAVRGVPRAGTASAVQVIRLVVVDGQAELLDGVPDPGM